MKINVYGMSDVRKSTEHFCGGIQSFVSCILRITLASLAQTKCSWHYSIFDKAWFMKFRPIYWYSKCDWPDFLYSVFSVIMKWGHACPEVFSDWLPQNEVIKCFISLNFICNIGLNMFMLMQYNIMIAVH